MIGRFVRRAHDQRLGRRLLLSILFCSSCFAVVSTGAQLYFEYTADMDALQERLTQIGESYIKPIANAVWYIDEDAVSLQMSGVLELPDIVHIIIRSRSGETYEAGTRPTHRRVRGREYVFREPRPPYWFLGTVTATADLSGIYNRFWERLLVVFVAQSLKTLAVSLAILILVRVFVTGRLERLSQHTRDVRLGAASASWVVDGAREPDEIDDVAKALQEMHASLASEARQREQEHQSRLELERSFRRLERLGAIGQLTSGISHDLNNFLMAIEAHAHSAATCEDCQRQGYLESLRETCSATKTLVSQVLSFARGAHAARQKVEPASCLAGMMELIRSGWLAGIKLTYEVANDLPPIEIIPIQLQQVILNLVLNARDAVGRTGTIAVSLGQWQTAHDMCTACGSHFAGEFVEVAVRDNGPGITEVEPSRVFEAFYTTKKGALENSGTGLGLSQVHGIVHSHGGHVVVATEAGVGTVFRTLWPAVGQQDRLAPKEASGRACTAKLG